MRHLGQFLIIICLLTIVHRFCVGQVKAKIELSYTSPPTQITANEEFTLEVALAGTQQDSKYFIRGVFYELETSNYFGFTQNNQGQWHNDSKTFDQYFLVTGEGTSTIRFKLDPQSEFFHDNAQYLFKIGRYTSGGTLTWSDQTPSIIFVPPLLPPSPTATPITPLSTPTPPLSATPAPTTITPQHTQTPSKTAVTLSEVMACPSENQPEWVELYNNADTVISLDKWSLRDVTDTHNTDLSGTINANSYFLISLSSAVLNNTGDSVRLFSDQNELVDQMSYTTCSSNMSFIKFENDWQISQRPTANAQNIWQPLPTSSPAVIPTTLSIPPTTTPKSPVEQMTLTPTEFTATLQISPIPIASISAIPFESAITQAPSPPGIVLAAYSTHTTTFPWLNKRTAFLTAGVCYISIAALLAQKWYNQTSLI